MLSFQCFSLIFENGPILASMDEQNHELKNRSTFSPSFPQIIPKIFSQKTKKQGNSGDENSSSKSSYE